MRPAVSVILLTTLIGAAQGLFLALFTVQAHVFVGMLAQPPTLARFLVIGSVLGVVLLIVGLLASFFHLGRPERAWRAASQWRTSWLSREVIVLPAFMAIGVLYGVVHAVQAAPAVDATLAATLRDASLLLAVVGSVGALALFLCTAMIYACLRFLAEWHTPLTLINFTLMGMASGFVLAALLASGVAPGLTDFLAGWALLLTLLAAVFRGASLRRNARLRPRSTLQSAIGVKHPQVMQTSQGFTGSSYNTREFFHGRTAQVVRGVKWGFVWLAFVLPALLLGFAPHAPGWLALALALQFTGLLAERWFFFAQARHPQNLYYQAAA